VTRGRARAAFQMRTLHLYLTRQMLATLGMTVFVFTLVLLLGNVIKEVLHLVVNRQATIGLALRAIALLVPYVLAFSLPIGMLTAALLVFGRFSADQELTAARASGISLISLITPVLLLSVAVSGLCAWLNCDIAPASRMAYKELLYRAGVSRPADLLQSNESTPFGDHIIFVGKVHADGTNLDTVIVSQYDKNGQLEELIKGASGTIIPDLAHHQITLNLHNEYGMHHYSDGWKPLPDSGEATFPIKVEAQAQKAVPLPISDMTFRQLQERCDEIERSMDEPPAKGKDKAEPSETQRELSQMTSDMMTPVLVYLNRAASFSFACIGFTLVGIPLGIRGHRRETSVGVATALVLMLIYYSFVVLGQAWADHVERAPYLIVWLPNFIFQAVGAVLLWRANRGL
jgi:lipopolysaccharide export system permease protein